MGLLCVIFLDARLFAVVGVVGHAEDERSVSLVDLEWSRVSAREL